jgi:hypothetical protein
MFRRTFLKIGSALVAGTAVATYAEPLINALTTGAKHQWVQDKGDYYVVTIPENKSFAKEHLDKPTIFLFGDNSKLLDVSVIGFANMRGAKSVEIQGCYFDAGKVSAKDRSAAILADKFTNSYFSDLHVIPPKDPCGVDRKIVGMTLGLLDVEGSPLYADGKRVL